MGPVYDIRSVSKIIYDDLRKTDMEVVEPILVDAYVHRFLSAYYSVALGIGPLSAAVCVHRAIARESRVTGIYKILTKRCGSVSKESHHKCIICGKENIGPFSKWMSSAAESACAEHRAAEFAHISRIKDMLSATGVYPGLLLHRAGIERSKSSFLEDALVPSGPAATSTGGSWDDTFWLPTAMTKVKKVGPNIGVVVTPKPSDVHEGIMYYGSDGKLYTGTASANTP